MCDLLSARIVKAALAFGGMAPWVHTVRRAFVTVGAGRGEGKRLSSAAERAEAKTNSKKKNWGFKVLVDPGLGSGSQLSLRRQMPKEKDKSKASEKVWDTTPQKPHGRENSSLEI